MASEINVSINTGNGQSDFETDNVDGYLKGLIISSNNPSMVSVTIWSELGYLIFHDSDHTGVGYYAPRAILQGPTKNQIVQDQFDEFKLNEKLRIIVTGPANTEIDLILRID